MSLDGFNNANKTFDFERKDIENIAEIYTNKDVLFDIFSVLGAIGLTMWVILFVFAVAGNIHTSIFVPIVGYIFILLIVIHTARKIYRDIEKDFDDKCNSPYLIESANRFYSILSFVYFYVKTYVITLINISLLCIGVFMLHRVIEINIKKDFEESWVVALVKNIVNVEALSFKILGYTYLALGLLVFFFIYLSIFLYLSSNALFDSHVFSRFSWMKNTFTGVVIGLVVLIFIIPIIYYNDHVARLWQKLIRRTRVTLTTTDSDGKLVDTITYPVLEIFAQGRVFKHVNLADKANAIRHMKTFIYGLVMSILFAFMVLPSYSDEKLCMLQRKQVQGISMSDAESEEYDALSRSSTQFQARFKFGYFMMMIVVIFFHIVEISTKAMFVSSGAMDLIDNDEDLDEEENTKRYVRDANEILMTYNTKNARLVNTLYDVCMPLFDSLGVSRGQNQESEGSERSEGSYDKAKTLVLEYMNDMNDMNNEKNEEENQNQNQNESNKMTREFVKTFYALYDTTEEESIGKDGNLKEDLRFLTLKVLETSNDMTNIKDGTNGKQISEDVEKNREDDLKASLICLIVLVDNIDFSIVQMLKQNIDTYLNDLNLFKKKMRKVQDLKESDHMNHVRAKMLKAEEMVEILRSTFKDRGIHKKVDFLLKKLMKLLNGEGVLFQVLERVRRKMIDTP